MRHRSDSSPLGWLLLIAIIALCFAIAIELNFGAGLKRLPSKEVIQESVRDAVAVATTSLADIVATEEEVEEESAQVVSLESVPLDTAKKLFIEVTDSCDDAYRGECLVVRSAPTTTAPVLLRLRTGVVLRAEEVEAVDGRRWYKLVFDEWLRYPERLPEDQYVAADFVEVFYDEGVVEDSSLTLPSAKKIIVDRSSQTLTAYDGDVTFLEASISTGLELTPTPRGTFSVFKKTPTRYMQGPLPYLEDKQVYDLPGVPWTLYFTEWGAAIHGTFWHSNFGTPQSHGCVNMTPAEAKVLYYWADIGTVVVVRD